VREPAAVDTAPMARTSLHQAFVRATTLDPPLLSPLRRWQALVAAAASPPKPAVAMVRARRTSR
jgi:hypothetical protein